ncbi:MAG: hypothetical protein Q4D16_00950 [Eubacteriales bacterium]|nr:hypothetical protein [Eubacteriales bacterium]
MKKTISMFIFILLFMGLFFYVKTEAHIMPLEESRASFGIHTVADDYFQSSVIAKPQPLDAPAGIQERALTQGITNLPEVRNSQRTFSGSMLALLLFIAANVLLNSTRSCMFWMLSICLTFLCVMLSQVSIIHQSDGKKRAVIF